MSELKKYKNKKNGGIVECDSSTKLDSNEWQLLTRKSGKKDEPEPNDSKES